MEQLSVTIPRGIISTTGRQIREITIRQINGYDEQAVSDISPYVPSHRRTLLFLKDLVTFHDDDQTIDVEDILGKLSIGDRVAILYNVRKMIFGDVIPCTVTCGFCNNKMSLDLNISDILNSLSSHDDPLENYDLEIAGYKIKLKPLNALDQDASIMVPSVDVVSVENMLAKLCIVSSTPSLPQKIPSSIVNALGTKMEEIDPLSNMTLDILCPECNKNLHISFPSEEFILQEILNNSKNLDNQIHLIAFYYGWNEADILSLPVNRRKKFIRLINATLGGVLQ